MSTNDELDAGQRRQVETLDALEASGIAIAGWKLGQTSGESRDAFGVGYRAFGYVRADRLYRNDEPVSWAQVTPGQIETELCMILTRDLTGDVTPQQARDAVRLAAGFELNQKRLGKEASPEERIADNLSNYGIVVGEPVDVPDNWQQEAMVVQICDEQGVVSEVAAKGHIDDHFETLATLANRLQQFGHALRQGDYVITGAYGRVPEPAPGRWVGKFSGIGEVAVQITA